MKNNNKNNKTIVVRKYVGLGNEAYAKYKDDELELSNNNYVPISQTWIPGSHSSLSFFAAFLFFAFAMGSYVLWSDFWDHVVNMNPVFVGFLGFVYLALVKPAGMLVVVYNKQNIVYKNQ